MIGAIVGLLVGQGDLQPGATTRARVPRPNAGALAAVAAVHALAFTRGDAEAALRDLYGAHPCLGSMPGVGGMLRGGDDWILSVPPDAEGFVPWPVSLAWLCRSDWSERVVAMMSVAYPETGDHTRSTLAACMAVRMALDGADGASVAKAVASSYPGLAAGPVGTAALAGVEAGLSATAFDHALVPFSGAEPGYDRGTAAFVAGAVASARLEVPGWAYLACCDLLEDVVLGGMDVFEAMLADPTQLTSRAPRAVRPYNDLPSVHDAPVERGIMERTRATFGAVLSLAKRGSRMLDKGNR